MQEELTILERYLREENLKTTSQRELILKVFLKTTEHVSAEELYELVKKEDPSVGLSTVFRTLKIFYEAGLAREVDFGDKILRYEHEYGRDHHDHLICTKCGSYIEAMDPEIERLQDELCAKFGFLPEHHRLEIFGLCKKCRPNETKIQKKETNMNLALLKPGENGIIKKIGSVGPLKRRLMDMGILVGEKVSVIKIAPLGDPIEIKVKKYNLSLRKSEACEIAVEVV